MSDVPLEIARAYDLEFRFPAGDTAVGASLRDYGEFARVILDFLVDHAGDAGTLLDVGANIGAIALPFASRRPGWKVLAIEAHAELADILDANAKANGLANLSVVRAAAGAETGVAEFPAVSLMGERNFGDIGFDSAAEAMRPVPMVTLDEVSNRDVRLVKIDVEGFEPQVLAGAAALIAARRAVWLVEATIQHPEATAEVIRTFRSAGYEVCWFFAPFATPANGRAAPATPGRGDSNIVALPPGTGEQWGLTRVADPDQQRPGGIDAYPYLLRYGYA
ncbi:FkbM family methyltransferase [Phenylobacterium sp.]|uniref:FkbM family methyltransferase n=1 Tax=Phenylobacterium sp. TaxID=1871053 RepID=UPI00301BFA91